MNPNALAWTVLFGWPVVAIAVYALRRRHASLARTTAWMMILPAMFLPANLVYDPPLLPALDKHRLTFLTIFLSLKVFHRNDLLRRSPWHRLPEWALAFLVLGAIQTARTNTDTLRFGSVVLPGLTHWDMLSESIAFVLDIYLPFVVGQRVFKNERDLRDLLEVVTLCGLIYLPLALLEVRFAPQLHYRLYGYYPSGFSMAVRGGGYRPIVFMNHGLSVAMFVLTCFTAALGLKRLGAYLPGISPGKAAAGLGILLLACKSLGSILYGVAGLALQWLGSGRALVRVLVLLVAIVVSYPLTRTTDIFPTGALLEAFSKVSPQRAASLAYRFRNEEELVHRAMTRSLFGWGGYARAHVWTDWGQDLSVTDGHWIIALGNRGLVGFGAFFALLLIPIVRFVRVNRRMPQTTQIHVGTLALIVAISAVDLLPNGRSDYLPLAYAGALFTLAATLVGSGEAQRGAKTRGVISITGAPPHFTGTFDG